MQQPSPSHIAAPAEFVGRSAELRWLSRSLADAQAGRPRVVVVVGEAGLGKSRLIEELSARARRAGTQVLSGRGEADLVLPHRLLGEALRPALEAQRAERPAETQLALSLLEGSAAGSQRAARVEAGPAGDVERWRAIQALEACVISMAQRRPLMICIDDLHWSDRPSLELLVRILHAGTEAARHAPLPLFIVCGSRPLEVDAALAAPLDRLEREEGVRVLELGGLSPDSVGQLMERAGLLNATRHLSTAVHELTRGNPLFVLEVARHLVHHGTPEGGPGSRAEDLPMPRSIGAALRDRLSSLSDPTRELLERAACMGERFELDSLARVAGRAAADLVDSLEEAQREGVLLAEGAQFAFAHPLLRHALHREAGDLRRYRLHLEIADSLSDDAPEPTGSLLLEIAHHLVRAGPLAERARVARVVRQAGDQASALWAPSEAAEYYAAALDAAPEDSPPHARAELHQRAGVACYRAVDAPGARGHFERAVRAYQRAGDPAGVARARLEGMRVQITLEPLPYGSLAEVEPLEKALADLPDDEARLRGQIQQVLSGVYWTARQSDAAVRCARNAIAIARGLGDLHLESEARVALSLARTQTLELDEAIASAEAGVDAARAAQDAWLEGTALTRLPLVHFCRGDLAQAESVAAEAEECTRRSQDWTGLSVAVSSQLSIAAARGQLARARELAAELRRLAARSGYPWGAFGGLRAFVGLAFDGDEREEAEETLELLERPGGLFSEPGVTALVCWIYRQRMEVERGLRVDLREPLRAALRVQDSDHAPELGAVSALCGVILVARAMQEPALAEVPRHLLELSYARGVRLSSGWVYVLPRILGIAASLAGDADKAEEWFDDAEGVASESGAAIELAHTGLDRARLLIERGDRAAAHRYALRARARFGELGFRNLERRAARLADAIESRSADPAAEVRDEWVPAPQPANSRTPSRFLREFLERLDADNEAPLGEVATERDAVILMTDMAGSTERIARRGERAALQVMQRHNAILRGCLSETGGVEVQHTGDGIFACFEDTHLAIVCAARMQQAFADEAEAEGDGDPIAVRIGVSAGRVVPVEGRFFGSAVNLAARICAWASPGRIVVSGDVREQGDGAGFSFRDLGPTELKGFSDPMRLHEVVW